MKSKILLSILVVFAVTASIFAKDISFSKAEQVAVNFLFQKSNQYGEAVKYHDLSINESYLVDDAYYVVNFDEGWVLVSSNDVTVPVLGYNFTGKFPATDTQIASFKSWMQSYVDQVDYVRENDIKADADVTTKWNTYLTKNPATLNIERSRDVIEPMLTSRWNQDSPYNAMCPEDAAGPGGHVYVGCVATAMVEIMHYWRFPLQGDGSHSYYCPPYGTLSADFGASDYNWNGMTDIINNKFIWEIAEIGFHAGVSVDMGYAPDGSGAYSQDVPYALRTYFDFQNGASYLQKGNFSQSVWEDMMQADLDNFKPIYYSGRDVNNGGHAFVCDGYQGNEYHFNFGWGGAANGFYTLNDVGGFYIQQAMVKNIYPGDDDYPYFASGQTDLELLIGSFTDGSGPAEDYISGMDASWLISPQNAEDSVVNITLSFIEFNTASSDMVRVYDGGDDNAELIGEFSGDALPSNIISNGNELYITFSSTSTGKGFKMEYSAQTPTWCISQSFNNEAEGTMTDGSANNFFYNNSTTCMFFFSHPEAKKYYIDFTSFETEPVNDKIKVYDLVTSDLLDEFSGTEIPDPVSYETSGLMLAWTTNGSIKGQGWKFDYHVDGVGFEETIVENLAIYPNPTTGILNIKFDAEKQGDIKVKLISVNGQVIFNKEISGVSGQYNYSFDISNQAKGIYLLSIVSDNEKIDRKIVLK